jgi:S-adenosylmethionine:tRNA ribosyltransferase-isomerase
LILGGDRVRAQVIDRDEEGWLVRFPDCPEGVVAMLQQVGRMPLPPYIHRGDDDPGAEDRDRYQTVYAREPGAVAAPTAGLHFTDDLFERLDTRGVARATLTLHVGAGTFAPVRAVHVEEHRMHAERFSVPQSTADAIREARGRGGRVVAVGTTVVRALESCATGAGCVAAGRGECDLFVYPGYRFQVVDAMLTNFHLPKSTLLMLVCAFGGQRRVLDAYSEAVQEGYRFYSYGDAMLLVRAD